MWLNWGLVWGSYGTSDAVEAMDFKVQAYERSAYNFRLIYFFFWIDYDKTVVNDFNITIYENKK